MTAFKRQTTKWILVLFSGIFVLIGLMEPRAEAATDISVLYTEETADQKNKLMETLPKTLSAKPYNLSLLSIMDYSGKNKVLARMNASRMVIILGDAPMKILKNARITADLLIIQSLRQTLHSSKWTLHILDQATNLDALDLQKKQRTISTIGDLGTTQDLRALSLLIVNEQSISLLEVISKVAEKTIPH